MKKCFLVLFLCALQVCFGALPTVTFNSSTGSDTAASGAGPATALSGTAAATVAANNVVTLSVDGPDLSGVATDGSAMIYVNSSSGRKFSKITAVDNGLKTVTCQDNFANTEGTRGWGIGGKRATLAATLTLGVDAYEGHTWSFEDDASMALSAAYTLGPGTAAADGRLLIKSSVAGTLRTCNETSNAITFSVTTATHIDVKNIKFTCSNATRTSANIFSMVGCTLRCIDCVFGDSTNKINGAFTRSSGNPNYTSINCEFTNLITGTTISNAGSGYFLGCWIHNGAASGVTQIATALYVVNCLVTGNGADGINVGTGTAYIMGCTIHGNTGDGVDTSSAGVVIKWLFNNNITGNGGFGINDTATNTAQTIQGMYGYNNFGSGTTANTSGAYNNIEAGTGDLTVDPQYSNASGNNYAVGGNVRNKAFPLPTAFIGFNMSSTLNFEALGTAQPNTDAFSGAILSY